jgi:hypothetical protein
MATDGWVQATGSDQAISTYNPLWVMIGTGGISIPSGVAQFEARGTDYNTAYRSDVAASVANYSRTVITTTQISGSVYCGPADRCQVGVDTSYHIDTNGGSVYASRDVAGTRTTLEGPIGGLSFAAGDVCGLEVDGTGATVALKIYKALAASPTVFTLEHTTNDTDGSRITTAGRPGVFAYGSSTDYGGGPWTGANSAAAEVAVGSRGKKPAIHPGNHPGRFGRLIRTKRNNVAATVTIAGDITATDDSDTSALVGTETFAGTFAVTDDTDTLAAQGEVWNPAASRRAKTPVHPGAGPYNFLRFKRSARNTSLVALPVTGDIAATDDTDTSAITGTETIQAAMAASDAADSSAIAGIETIAGSLAVSDEADTCALVGSETFAASMAATDEADTSSMAGTETIAAAMAASDETDTSALAGTETIAAAVSVTDATDTSAVTGTETIAGAIGATDGADSCSFTDGGPTGTIDCTDEADTAALVGTQTITGSAAASDAADTGSIAGTETIAAALSVSDATDEAILAAVESLIASIGVSDEDDVSVISGDASGSVTGTISATDADDAAVLIAIETLIVSISATDEGDTSLITSGIPVVTRFTGGPYVKSARSTQAYTKTVRFEGPYSNE